MTETREHAHQLIDKLPEVHLNALVGLLETIVGPHDAEDEEEPLSEEDRRAVAASREHFRLNPENGVSFGQFVADCGFTMDQVLGHRE